MGGAASGGGLGFPGVGQAVSVRVARGACEGGGSGGLEVGVEEGGGGEDRGCVRGGIRQLHRQGQAALCVGWKMGGAGRKACGRPGVRRRLLIGWDRNGCVDA